MILTRPLQFATTVITVPFRNKPRKYTVRWRPISAAVQSIVNDPILNPLLHLYPERCYVRHFDGSPRNMRVWREEWDGDDWWDYQVSKLPTSRHCIRRLPSI